MKNPVRARLKQGQVSVGGWLNLSSPLAAEIMASCGLEWLTVDGEHSPFDIPLVAETFRAIENRGATPFIRTWDHDPVSLARLLDAGAYGIIVPHVSTPEQADAIAKAMRYPPTGTRSAGTGRIAIYGRKYYEVANDEILVIPQIEDMEGINNAEAIMSVEGIDVGFLGPGDLSISMGVERGSPPHEEALQKFADACNKVGKPCGIPERGLAEIKKRIDQGFQMIDIASDLRTLEAGIQTTLSDVRAYL